MLHELKIITDKSTNIKRIFIDGIEQKGVTACDIRLRPNETPVVRLEYLICQFDAIISDSSLELSTRDVYCADGNGDEHGREA